MSILINGVSGFVGSNILTALKEKDYQVESFSFRKTPNFEIIGEHISTVIHLAGKSHDLKKVSSSKEYYHVNVELTKQIFDAFLNSKATVFITLSSVKAVADIVEGVLREDVTPNPQTHYGKSKLLAEEYIFSKQIPIEKRVYILRPCMILGKGNKGNLNLLYNIVRKRIPYPLGAFANKRSFLSIENLSFVIDELIQNNKIPSGIYNLSDDKPISTIRLVELISESLKKNVLVLNIPKFIILAIAKIGDYLGLPLDNERLSKLTGNYVVSNEKIKNAINKEFPLTTEEGLKKTISSFQI